MGDDFAHIRQGCYLNAKACRQEAQILASVSHHLNAISCIDLPIEGCDSTHRIAR